MPNARPLAQLVVLLAALACGRPPSSPVTPDRPPAAGTPLRVLLITATAGFRHDSIVAARAAFSAPAEAVPLELTSTEDLALLTADRLGRTDVLVFGLTSGELALDGSQKAALLDFVDRGGGFMGFHSATDTFYSWPEYGALIGAHFKEHPWTRAGRVHVESPAHPATTGGGAFVITEEFYTFRQNPREHVQVLMSLDASSVGAEGDYPLVWVRSAGRGRVYYNALGHFSDTWSDARFRSELVAALRWVAQR